MRTAESMSDSGRAGFDRLARGLGWFGIGLGIAELMAPRRVARLAGAGDARPGLVRVLGAREVLSGVGILRGDHPRAWTWARVAGDAIDLAVLGLAMRNGARGQVLGSVAAVAGVALLDVMAAAKMGGEPRGGVCVTRAITVRRPAAEVERLWQRMAPMARFDEERVDVRFADAPGGRGTEVHVTVVAPPRQAVHLNGDLRRFKQRVETGDLVHSDASIHRGMHPGRPPEADEAVELPGGAS